ncbi:MULTISPECIES: CHAT domain-containing protein [unclassified Micromonospora]|uniref:CHAT domain-containing protein n=1 Tax=unclassified Micromonospora TaxID=2617518 RepID=UPI0033D43C4E
MSRPDETNVARRMRGINRVLRLLEAAAYRTMTDPRAAIAEIDAVIAEHRGDPQVEALAEVARKGLELAAGYSIGDGSRLRASVTELGAMVAGHPEGDQLMGLLPGYLDALQTQQGGDTSAAVAMLADLADRTNELPQGNLLRESMAEVMPMVRALQAATRGEASALPLPRAGSSDAERALHLAARGGTALRMGDERDEVRIAAAIADLREAVSLTPEDHPDHVFHLASLALGLYHRSTVTGLLSDVNEAVTVLERARDLAGGPGNQYWSYVTGMLGQLRNRLGEASPARLAMLEGLRGYAWRVLLEPDPATARAVAGQAATEAIVTASHCLVEQQPEDALRALDGGRALMLFAATELRDPATRLTAAGHPELAARWRATDTPDPLLREDVLQVLARDTGLLDPPGLDEIRDALRRLGVDALAYLVPTDPPTPGWAVIAPAAGEPWFLALPNLTVGEGTDVERYLTAVAGRSPDHTTREVGTDDPAEFADRVDALCGWAWKAAMGPLVEPFLSADRVPRLVLIPMGDLARVPWQAARDPGGTYLVERVALSQAASARMFCDTAAAEPVRLTSGGMVLADPDTGRRAADLRSARLEAYGIHQSFYPAATYVGRWPNGRVSPSGAGTPADVRSWLLADATQAGTMLHLASHGVIETARASTSSRLLLAGGDLTADELITLLADPDRHPIGLVVLAACHTGRSIHGYDEAYSLGTTFLAAGARSVLSTQWSIPDQDTSLLMFMFHHFLTTEHRAVWDALRRAQIWMLDGDRQPPRTMPGPLRRMLADTDPARVVAWAGFTHWGQ